MLQRRLLGVILLFRLGLALPGGTAAAQNALPSPPVSIASAPAGTPVAPEGSPPQVIATARPAASAGRTHPTEAGPQVSPPPGTALPEQKPAEELPKPPGVGVSPPPPGPPGISRPPAPLHENVVHEATPVQSPVSTTAGKPDAAGGLQLVSGVGRQTERSVSTFGLEVIGPGAAGPGQPLRYAVIVRNQGKVATEGVRIDLPVPSGCRFLGGNPPPERDGDRLRWVLGDLEAGAERRLDLELQPTGAAEVRLRPLASFASAFGPKPGAVRSPLSLAVQGPEFARVGETVIIPITAGNNTRSAMRAVRLRCDLVSGLLHPQGKLIEAELEGDIAPGQVRTVQLEVQARTPGRHRYVVTATAANGQTARVTGAVTVTEAALSMEVTGPRQAAVGQVLPFQVELSNPGPNPSGIVRLTQSLPGGVAFVSAGDSGTYNAAAHSITWTLPGVPGGGRRTVTFQVRAKQGGDWALGAAARTERLADLRATRAIQIEERPTLTLEAAAQEGALRAGGEAHYEVRVYNPGDVPAREVRMTVQVPANLLPVSADGPSAWRIQGQRVTFEAVPELRGRMDAVFRVRVRGGTAGEGQLRFDVHAKGLPRPLSRELTSHVAEGTPGFSAPER